VAKFIVTIDDSGQIVAITRNPEEATFLQSLVHAFGGLSELYSLLSMSPTGIENKRIGHDAGETFSGLTLGDKVRASERLTPEQKAEIFHLLDNRLPALDEWKVVSQGEGRTVHFGENVTAPPGFVIREAGGARMMALYYFVDP
jgi:hypothetical protein